MKQTPRLFRRAILALMFVALVAHGAEEGDPPAATTDSKPIDPGLRALDILAELKKSSEARSSACLKAFGRKSFCQCLNNRLTLDLSFDDYIVLVTNAKGDPAYLSLPADKQRLVGDAIEVRDQCVKTMFDD